MRRIYHHKVNGLNEAITVTAKDVPGAGGANHLYELEIPGAAVAIKFQNGPIGEAGVNGVSNEALLAVLIDRMQGFQFGRTAEGEIDRDHFGKYACVENALALAHLENAMAALHSRTRERTERGVEGTHKV